MASSIVESLPMDEYWLQAQRSSTLRPMLNDEALRGHLVE